MCANVNWVTEDGIAPASVLCFILSKGKLCEKTNLSFTAPLPMIISFNLILERGRTARYISRTDHDHDWSIERRKVMQTSVI